MTGRQSGGFPQTGRFLMFRVATSQRAALLIPVLCCFAATGAIASAQDKMEWFRHDKFGMFVHWGPYSLLAGEWKGQRTPAGDEAEWIMQRFNIPVKDYREMAHGLNPVKFDAEPVREAGEGRGDEVPGGDGQAPRRVCDVPLQGERLQHRRLDAVQAGHCEGTRGGVPEQRASASASTIRTARTGTIRAATATTGTTIRRRKISRRYLREKSLPQLRELLTNYGPLGLIWFDRGIDTTEQAKRFIDLVHELQPQCLINGRVGNYGHELLGDYQNMNDNGMPTGGLDEYWETPQTLNGTWGYSKFDQEWKTPANVIQRMVEIVSKGGNYLSEHRSDGGRNYTRAERGCAGASGRLDAEEQRSDLRDKRVPGRASSRGAAAQ